MRPAAAAANAAFQTEREFEAGNDAAASSSVAEDAAGWTLQSRMQDLREKLGLVENQVRSSELKRLLIEKETFVASLAAVERNRTEPRSLQGLAKERIDMVREGGVEERWRSHVAHEYMSHIAKVHQTGQHGQDLPTKHVNPPLSSTHATQVAHTGSRVLEQARIFLISF